MNTDMHGEEIFCLQILESLVSGFQKLLSAYIRKNPRESHGVTSAYVFTLQ